jgi:glycosyltransferase involved in cell wall biosynthesis
MPRIAYLTPRFFGDAGSAGSAGRYPLELARAVAAVPGLAVEVLSVGPEPFLRELAPGLTLRVACPEPGTAGRDTLDALTWAAADTVAAADLVHVFHPHTRFGEAALLLARLHGKPAVVTDLGAWSSGFGPAFGWLDLAAHVVAPSAFAAGAVRTTAPVTVIPGVVGATRFADFSARRPRDRFAFVGRILPHKGVDRLIRALPPNLPLTCCGPADGDNLAVLKPLAAGKGVEFVHDAHDAAVAALYSRAWAVVLPSVYRDFTGNDHPRPEPVGLAMMEAMAAGTPVVAARVGALPEVVADGETGFLFDTEAELTARLTELAADPALVERLGTRAKAVANERFTANVAGPAVAAVYRTVLAGMS